MISNVPKLISPESGVPNNMMLFARVEKQGKYRDSWTVRRIAFDTETGEMYCSAKENKLRVVWRHKVRVVRIIARTTVCNMNVRAADLDPYDVFSFKVEGSFRHIGSGLPSHYQLPAGNATVMCPRVGPADANGKHEPEKGTGEMLVWYMRVSNETDFLKIYTTIRDVMIRDGMRPPQFWGLPKMDPRNRVPLVEPPIYLWHTFRAVKQCVCYACVHGHMVVKGADLSSGGSVNLCEERMYLTLFDSSVMVFRENGRVVCGIPVTSIKSLHYATVDVEESIKDPDNKKYQCFLAFVSNKETYPDIFFVPRLERFADPTEERVPAAQVNRVKFAVEQLGPLIQHWQWKAGIADATPIELKPVDMFTRDHEDEIKEAPNGLIDVYARLAWKQNPLHFPDISNSDGDKRLSDTVLKSLPPPRRLSALTKELGIKMNKALTDYPDRHEYLASEATGVNSTTSLEKRNPLQDMFLVATVY